MKAVKLTVGILALVGASVVSANEASDSSKDDGKALERIEKKIDSIKRDQDIAHRDLINQPLANKNYGIEFNPFRVLAWEDDYRTMSGTFSIFDTDKNVEIAFPVYWEQDGSGSELDPDFRSFTVDVHYRKFLGQTLNGFYISGFVRLAHLSGTTDGTSTPSGFVEGVSATDNKAGLGFGIGYRVFSANDWYWGTSLSLGRYGNEGNTFQNGNVDDGEFIFDVELFKFGFSF